MVLGILVNTDRHPGELKVIDLSKRETSYESVVDYIFSYDRVISW